MLSALCIADLAAVNIHNNPFGNNALWVLLEKDLRIGPWTWAEHVNLAPWLLAQANISWYYHATNFPAYTPTAYAASISIRTIDRDMIRSGFGRYGGRAMDFGPPIKVPLHAPATRAAVVDAGATLTVLIGASEGNVPYTYSIPADAPDWMHLGGGFVQLRPPMKHPGGNGQTVVTVMDDEGQTADVVIIWVVNAVPPTQ